MRKALIVLILLAVGFTHFFAQKVSCEEAKNTWFSVLRRAELFRAPFSEMSLKVTLNNPDSESRSVSTYSIFFKDETKTLAAFLTPKFDRGNLLLMIKDTLWFYAKNTSRATRITPIQRLSGAVSYGDIARLGWTQDYEIKNLKTAIINNDPCFLLTLAAKSPGATYQSIKLITDSESRPLSAEVYLLSGKLYKTLRFTKYENISGKEMATQIEYTDHLNKDRVTTLVFTEINPEESLPNRYFLSTSLQDLGYAVFR
jgi:hypothetical protein